MTSEALTVLQVRVSVGSPDLCWEIAPPFLQIIFNEAQICYLCLEEAWFNDTYVHSKVHHISPDISKKEKKKDFRDIIRHQSTDANLKEVEVWVRFKSFTQ